MRGVGKWLALLGLVACGGGAPAGRVDPPGDAAPEPFEARMEGVPSDAPADGPRLDADSGGGAADGRPEVAEVPEVGPEVAEVPEVGSEGPEDPDTGPRPPEAAEPGEPAPEVLEALDEGGDAPPPEAPAEGVDACGPEGACPACSLDGDCDDGLPCTGDACLDGQCRHEAQGLCCDPEAGAASCDDANPCTHQACLEGRCAWSFGPDPGCCHDGPLPDAAWSFEAGLPAGAVVEGAAGSLPRWTTSPLQATDGARSLWFGDPASGTYANPAGPAGQPLPAAGTLTLPPVALPPGGVPYLAFDLRLDTEWNDVNAATWEIPGPQLAYDELTVLANGTPVWSSFVYEIAGSTCRYGVCSVKPVEISLAPFAGQSVALSFRFDSKTAVANDHAGPFLDRVRLASACAPFDCFSSMECDDAKDTLDVCTRDKCIGRQCVFERTYLPGVACCWPVDQVYSSFEAGLGDVVVEASGPVTWQVVGPLAGGRVYDGQGSLYLGDPVTRTYADPAGGPVVAEATWTVEVPPFTGYVLEWWQWLDLADAADPARDVFTVSVRAVGEATDGGQIVFTNKPLYGYPAVWRRVSASLDPWLGGPVEVVFRFDSGDGTANDGEGIYLDALTRYYGCD